MRAVIQRVKRASVTVDGELISSIKEGLCVLVGISRDDSKKDMEYIANKILKLRLFEEDGTRWKKSVIDLDYEVLCVSQFTLMCVLKGNKPDFHKAMDGERSKAFYEEFLAEMKKRYRPEAIKGMLLREKRNDSPRGKWQMKSDAARGVSLVSWQSIDWPDFQGQEELWVKNKDYQKRRLFSGYGKQDGKFATYMQVEIQNDGPVTIQIDSPLQNKSSANEQKANELDGKETPDKRSENDEKSDVTI